MDLYAENILDHYRHPRSKQSLVNPAVTHQEVNLSCGDTLSVSLTLDGERITGVGWEGMGCAISQAAMSMLSEELVGKTLSDIDALTGDDVIKLLGVPVGARRKKCALLSLHVLKNSTRKFRNQKPQTWNETAA
jgi:nitrogen fixation NifU-like protein